MVQAIVKWMHMNRRFINNFNRLFSSYRSNIKSRRFMRNLFISYFLIVVICISAMGILSYSLERQRIVDLTIKSNNELLNHFKCTIDDLILGNLNKLSLNVLQNVINDSDTSYYFSNSFEDDYTGLLEVMKYLAEQKNTNPMLRTIAIYYRKNDILVSNDGVSYKYAESVIKDNINKLFTSNLNNYWTVSREKDKVNPDNGYKGYIYLVRKVAFISHLSESAGGIAISVDEDILHNTIKGSAPVDFGDILIIDENGTIISHKQKEYLFLSVKELPYGKELLNTTNKSGSFMADIDGEKSLVSFTSSGISNWRYVTVKPIAMFYEGFQILGRLILIIGIISFMFSLFASVISTRHFYSLLKKLGDLCRNIINIRPVNRPKDEYELIGSTLGAISVKLKENEEQLEKSIPIIKHQFIYNLVYQGFENRDEIYEKMNFLNIKFPYDNFMIIALKLGKTHPFVDYRMYEYIKLEIIKEVESIFSIKNKNCICTEVNNKLIAIINLSSKADDIMDRIAELSIHLNEIIKLILYIGVSSSCESITDVHRLFIEAESCLNYSYLHPGMNIFTIDEIQKWELKTPESGKNLLKDLCNSLKAQDKKSTLSCLHNLFNTIRDEHYSYNYSMKLLTKFSIYIESILDILRIDKSEIIEGDFITCFNRANNIYDLEKWLVSLIIRIFEFIESRKSEKVSGLVSEVKEYISENITNCDLSLNAAADAMCISATYLSRIFKDETGMNFVDYLMDAKLATAEKMLISSDLKVEKISSLIGYSSPQYFIKKFKGQYGSTPKEYRMAFLRKDKSISTAETEQK